MTLDDLQKLCFDIDASSSYEGYCGKDIETVLSAVPKLIAVARAAKKVDEQAEYYVEPRLFQTDAIVFLAMHHALATLES